MECLVNILYQPRSLLLIVLQLSTAAHPFFLAGTMWLSSELSLVSDREEHCMSVELTAYSRRLGDFQNAIPIFIAEGTYVKVAVYSYL